MLNFDVNSLGVGGASAASVQRPIKDKIHVVRQKSVPQERAVDVPLDLLDSGRLKVAPEVVREVVAPQVAPQVFINLFN